MILLQKRIKDRLGCTLPTASVFTLGANDGNTCNDGDDYIAYCFHSVDGYSMVGSYTGNAVD